MPRPICIHVGSQQFQGSLVDGPTADAIYALLPIEGTVQRSGGEVAVELPFECAPEEHARNRMLVGEIAYWSPGRTLSIFCGPTPLSTGEIGDDAQPIASSAVTPIGTLDDPKALAAAAPSGIQLRIATGG